MRVRSTFERTSFNASGGGLADAFRNTRLDDAYAADEAMFDDLLTYQNQDRDQEQATAFFLQEPDHPLTLDAQPSGFPDMPVEPPVWPYASKKGIERVYRVV